MEIILFRWPKTASNVSDSRYPESVKTKRIQQSKAAAVKATSDYSIIKSVIGDLMLVTDGSALTGLYFAGRDHIPALSTQWNLNARHPLLQKAARQLEEYFAGKRTSFSVPLRLSGTDFQEKVWREIARIPYGQTITYSELAQRAGASQAVRAAGTITGRNPVSIIVPCHRVVGKDGGMCGFAGGLEKKQRLLELERSGGKLAV
jgi:methylated-DNA-[protein]-cysteine S-methyltransferase